MAAPYDIYPAVDSTYNFPPVIRQALVQSTDVQAALAAERSTTNTRFDTERQITNDQFVFERTVTNQKFGTERTQTNADRSAALADYDTRAVVAARGRTKSYASMQDMIADKANLNNGDIAVVGRFQFSSGVLHRASTWQKSNDKLGLLSRTVWVEAADRSGTQQAANAIISLVQGASYNPDTWFNAEFRNIVTPHAFTWDGGRIVPRTGLLLRRRWEQWAFGPATRADWWSPPMDVWNDDYGVANNGCGFIAPANGFYRITGQMGYQQNVSNERVIWRMRCDALNSEYWSGGPSALYGDTGYPFQFMFYCNYGENWNFGAYHSGASDLYIVRGEANKAAAINLQVEFLGSNA